MIETANRVEQAVGQLDAALSDVLVADLAALSATELVDALRALERHRRRLAAADVQLLAQVRDRGVARELCRTSPADLLITELRVSPAEATARCLATEDCGPRVALSGEVLAPILPRVAAALEAGEVSAGHVSVIGKAFGRIPLDLAAEVIPVAEALLVEAARHEHPRALQRTATLLLARLNPDGREPRVHRRREFMLSGHGDGWSTARGTLDPAATAAVGAVLDALAAPRPADDGVADPRTASERRHDGLQEMAQRLLRSETLPSSGGVATTVVITGTVDDWFRRPAENGVVRGARDEWWRVGDIRPCGDPFCDSEIAAVVTNSSGAPLALGRTRRLANPSQRLALAARDRGCCFPGCNRPPAWTEAHHILAWQDGGPTDLSNLCLLCSFHHREFGRRGWAVHVVADGLPEWTPPASVDPHRRPVRNRAHHHPEIEFAAPG